MNDELKYPRVFALMPVKRKCAYKNAKIYNGEIYCYVVSPCYLVQRIQTFRKECTLEFDEKVVFPRKYLGLLGFKNEDKIDETDAIQIPEPPYEKKYKNAVSVDFITYDYEEAIKERDRRNKELFWDSFDFIDGKNCFDEMKKYIGEIDDYQEELNSLENPKQVTEYKGIKLILK